MRILLFILIIALGLQAGFLDMFKSFTTSQENPEELPEVKVRSAAKEALEIGVKEAIKTLGKKDGFYKNPLVKIPIPKNVENIANTLRKVGMGKYVDQFKLAMNEAAQEAVPETASILMKTIKQMSIEDAKNLVFSDKEDAITSYFKTHTAEQLKKRVAPIIKKHIEQEKVTDYYQKMVQYYNQYAKPYTQNKYAKMAMQGFGIDQDVAPKENETDLTTYVTNRTLDGLFKMIAQKEAQIRKNPITRTTKLLKEVFSAARK